MGTASLRISTATLASDGITFTVAMTGGSGTLSPASTITGFSPHVFSDFSDYTVSTATRSGTTVTLVASNTIASGATVYLDLAISGAGSNLTDAGANVPSGQTNFSVTNNSNVIPPTLSNSVVSFIGSTYTTINISGTTPSGNVGNVSYQWKNSLDDIHFTNMSGKTSTTLADSSTTEQTQYYYELIATDEFGRTSTSNNVGAALAYNGPLKNHYPNHTAPDSSLGVTFPAVINNVSDTSITTNAAALARIYKGQATPQDISINSTKSKAR